MSPVSAEFTNLDLVKLLRLPVILVSRTYLGSINHTMLTHEVLHRHDVHVGGIVFNGTENKASEDFILRHTGLQKILSIAEEDGFDKNKILQYASQLPANLFS
jgi:dethiobiotin synthetase